MDNKKLIFIIVGLMLVAGGVGFWYWQSQPSRPILSRSAFPTPPAQPSQLNQVSADISLGVQILEKIQNPAKDKLPETNPFQDMYQNPF